MTMVLIHWTYDITGRERYDRDGWWAWRDVLGPIDGLRVVIGPDETVTDQEWIRAWEELA